MGAAPITLRCGKCKRGEDWNAPNRLSGKDIVRTGKTRIAKRYGRMMHVTLHQMKHVCGNVFWSNHPDAKHKPVEMHMLTTNAFGTIGFFPNRLDAVNHGEHLIRGSYDIRSVKVSIEK